MSITSDLLRGHTETIILAHLAQDDSYGYEINKSVKTLTSGDYELKEATLYSAFRRLEDQGLIQSYWGDQDSGARRRYYTITSVGRKALERNHEDWEEAKKIIDSLIYLGGNHGK
ncbi:PadR family transcriptional regulator [Erysipelothrix larvae]|uniref:PadR family transcriptional regulator n=1 Tax=Erysipelothrix larvae TaxID=1514105 RepID=A0A120JTS8_9FIRM|nr:PadR family transcriptional regulator [Erysipelothrix larvae]AMC93825.1 PadR family transcriptional regulator [Erysipelothrix larvae]